ncbi:MAG: T9SS type A sorting domain-containing protein [Ignavibacterium sp.]|nr:T9SS type A sorting domain-containing protein [Ignavibacterium sp.]
MNQGVWRSTTNGESWTQINDGFHNLDNTVNSLAINSFGHIYAGSVNSIYRSTNSGNSWTAISSPNYNGFYPLFINSNDDIVVGAGGSRLFRSTNNGQDWTEITIANAQIGAIGFNELGHLFVGNIQGVYRSTNNGNNWTQINNGINIGSFIAVNDFSINSLGTIYVGLGGGFSGSTSKGVFYSTNNGDNWFELNDGLINNAVASLTIDNNDFLFAGNTEGQVYKSINPTTATSINKTLTDLNIPISNSQSAISTINFSPPGKSANKSAQQNISSVQIKINEVLHTRTGDLTFTLGHLGVSQTIILEVGADGENFIYTILGDDNTILVANGIAPFTGYYVPSNSLSVFNGLDPYGDWTLTITDGYAGNDGILNSWSLIINLDGTTDIEEENELILNSYSLSQNYPNPFNPTTKIRFTIPSSPLSFGEWLGVRLVIYDLLGREKATIVNEEKPAGTYEVTFDATGLSSGVYLYKITAGDYSETKKMVLIR